MRNNNKQGYQIILNKSQKLQTVLTKKALVIKAENTKYRLKACHLQNIRRKVLRHCSTIVEMSLEVENGLSTLKSLVDLAGDKIEIMPAGKVTTHNIGKLHQYINARAYHGKRIVGLLK